MSNSFNQRVFGCAIIKSINSNYNADFSHQPRTLPDGTAYATDKVLKYSIRNYWDKVLGEKVFYFKSLSESMSPRTLDETFELYFGDKILKEKDKNKVRLEVLKNILTCLDVRVFGGTYAGKTNLSLHGTTQFTHGINRYPESVIYSEQIMSPFRNPGSKSEDSTQTTLGTQSKLQEGHYVHHFSVNPKNLAADAERASNPGLTDDDVDKLKEGLRKGVSYYDSSAKAGTENELLLWVQLKEDSKAVFPSFVELVEVNEDKDIDLKKISDLLAKEQNAAEIEKIELYYNSDTTTVINAPANSQVAEL